MKKWLLVLGIAGAAWMGLVEYVGSLHLATISNYLGYWLARKCVSYSIAPSVWTLWLFNGVLVITSALQWVALGLVAIAIRQQFPKRTPNNGLKEEQDVGETRLTPGEFEFPQQGNPGTGSSGVSALKKSEEQRQKQEFAKELGFVDTASLERAQRFAALPAEEQERILADQERKSAAELLEHEPSDLERRAERVEDQARTAPERRTPDSNRVTAQEVRQEERPKEEPPQKEQLQGESRQEEPPKKESSQDESCLPEKPRSL